MQVTRMDLDGTGSPMGLVGKILKAEPTISIPVPVEELATQLDIAEIRDVTTRGFEGGLITDDARSSGFILVNNEARLERRRFTIGHELGHFLMTTHKPGPDGFRCSRDDMRQWNADGKNANAAIEMQANEFSALLLMPPPLWRKETAKLGAPDLSQIVRLAKDFRVSKEAAARTFAQYHDESIAIVVAKDGRIDRVYRKATGFPFMCARIGMNVPNASLFHRAPSQFDCPSAIEEARAEFWLQSDWGKPLPGLYEQVQFQQNGFALIMLWAEFKEEDDEYAPDEDRTSKQRLADRQGRWGR